MWWFTAFYRILNSKQLYLIIKLKRRSFFQIWLDFTFGTSNNCKAIIIIIIIIIVIIIIIIIIITFFLSFFFLFNAF